MTRSGTRGRNWCFTLNNWTVVFPPTKTKKRIQPTLLSNAPQPLQGLGSSNQTAGQKRMQNTVNRMEKFYSDPQHQF